MTTQESKRKLTAILSADVKGYSLLMREDEEATVRTLTECKALMSHLIESYRGRVVDSPGDNLLAEFASVVDALRSGVEIQRQLKAKNQELSENRRMEFRIGINLGDVIEEGGRIYGDGVNIAARMEGLAEAGGICVSGTVYEHVKDKVPMGYAYLGEQNVKNIREPVRVYRMLMEPEQAGKVIGEKKPRRTQWRWVAAALAALVLVAGGLVWNVYWGAPRIEPASKEKMAFHLPDKPSIAVLPFDNMSDDPKQEFFSDGITEEIITALARSPHLFVIARNSTFTYKGKPVKVKQVAEDLGVRYVLEGSVRREAERVRITAQLIDALKGQHLWAERYDRETREIFALQDEITVKVMTALHVKLQAGDHVQVLGSGTKNLDAFLKAMEAREHMYRYTKEDNAMARKLYEEVIILDSRYALGYAGLGGTHINDIWLGTSKSPKESLARGIQLGQKAIALDESNGMAHAALSYFYAMVRQYDKAVAHADKAVALDPNSSGVLFNAASALVFSGKLEEAIPLQQKALRLNPFGPSQYFNLLSVAYRMLGKDNEALEQARKAVERDQKNQFGYANLAAACILTGHEEEARAAAADLLKINPKFSLEQWGKALPYKDQTQVDRTIESLRKAGLPEKPPLPLPDKPSIAVLPFVNMSDEKDQEYFTDGLTEEIITALSKTPQLFVIARNSSFVYKGKSVNVQQVSRELGVKYVLEGSIQRSGDRIRINAQLIDALTGHHLWSERYDRDLKDVFVLQDDITMKIITALQVKLTSGEMINVLAKGAKNIDAFTKYLQAVDLWTRLTKEANAQAKKLLEEAIALDPEYPGPYIGLAKTYGMDVFLGTTKSPDQSLAQAIELAQKAISLDNTNGAAYSVLSWLYATKRQYEKAIAESERAISLNPNSAESYMRLGLVLAYAGRAEEGILYMENALRLNPFPSSNYFTNLATIYCESGHYEKAIDASKKSLQSEPNSHLPYVTLAISYIRLGREEEARAASAEIRRINTKFSLDGFAKVSPFPQLVTERRMEDLRKAGLK
jgi:adenylate cyclase